MDPKLLSCFIYGTRAELKVEDAWKPFVMALCTSNHSFLEFVSKGDFSIARYVNLYHVRGVRLESEVKVVLRLSEHAHSLKIRFPSAQKAAAAAENLRRLLAELRQSPYTEFSLKNLIRYVLYYTRLANVDGCYTKDSIRTMFKRMHIFYEEAVVKQIMTNCVKDGSQVTTFDFRRVFKVLFLKPEFAGLFRGLLKIPASEKIDKQTVSVEFFHEAFVRPHNRGLKLETLTAFFEQIERSSPLLASKGASSQVDFESFCCFLFSPLNSANPPAKPLDLHGKLCDFYIGTALRPELVGHDTDAKIRLEGILDAFENHARFIELSCFDGPDGEPMLSNSPDIRGRISISEALAYVAECAFSYTDLPLLLSLQVDCSKQQRDRLGKILMEAFGDKLYLLTKDALHSPELPEISELRGRVLVKTAAKYPLEFQDETHQAVKQVYSETLDELDHVTALFSEKKVEHGLKTVFGVYRMSEALLEESQNDTVRAETLADFHKRYLCLADSQANPQLSLVAYWNLGVQLVAVSPQQLDEASFLHKILFERHGRSGFIPKPESLTNRPASVKFGREERIFKLTILSGQILHSDWTKQHEQFFPYVRVKYVGSRFDMKRNPPVHTCIDEMNPFHCQFEWASGAEFHRFEIARPELGVLLFEVVNAKTERLIKRGLVEPATMLAGVHSVTLFDTYNHFDSFSSLVIKVDEVE